MHALTQPLYDEESLRIDESQITIGWEQEYAFLDQDGNPAYFVRTEAGPQATWIAVKNYVLVHYGEELHERFTAFTDRYGIAIEWELVPEVFKNMIEVVGLVARLEDDNAINDLIEFHVFLFELISCAATHFGLQLMDPSSFNYRRVRFDNDWQKTISVESDHQYYDYYASNIAQLIEYSKPDDNGFVPGDAARYPMGTATHATIVGRNNRQTQLIYGAQRDYDAQVLLEGGPDALDMSSARYQGWQCVTVAARVELGGVLHGDTTIEPVDGNYLDYSIQRYEKWLRNNSSENFYFGGKDHSMVVIKPIAPTNDHDTIGPEAWRLGVERRASDNRPTRQWVEKVIRNHVFHVRHAIAEHNSNAYALAQAWNERLAKVLES